MCLYVCVKAQTQLASLYLERNENIPQAFQLLAKASAQGVSLSSSVQYVKLEIIACCEVHLT